MECEMVKENNKVKWHWLMDILLFTAKGSALVNNIDVDLHRETWLYLHC